MKTRSVATGLLLVLLFSPVPANEAAPAHSADGHSAEAPSEPVAESPLTADELALVLDSKFLRSDSAGEPYLLWEKEPLPVERVLELSPWDLMKVYQTLVHKPLLLSRFGQGDADPLTQAWRDRLAEFLLAHQHAAAHHADDLFDPGLVVWDPGYIQKQNEWGQWYIRLDRRDIVQKDLATLSPLEVQQALEVLTNRTYPVEFVMDHLEEFRAQLTVHQRLVEVKAEHGATPAAHH